MGQEPRLKGTLGRPWGLTQEAGFSSWSWRVDSSDADTWPVYKQWGEIEVLLPVPKSKPGIWLYYTRRNEKPAQSEADSGADSGATCPTLRPDPPQTWPHPFPCSFSCSSGHEHLPFVCLRF